MIYHKEYGIIATEGLMSATPLFLFAEKNKKFKIVMIYFNGMQTQLHFETQEKRDEVLEKIQKSLNCVEVN